MFVTFLVVQSICLAYLNMFARFDENPAMTQDIKETKRYGRTDACTHGRMDNVKTVYPPQKVCGGVYNKSLHRLGMDCSDIIQLPVGFL